MRLGRVAAAALRRGMAPLLVALMIALPAVTGDGVKPTAEPASLPMKRATFAGENGKIAFVSQSLPIEGNTPECPTFDYTYRCNEMYLHTINPDGTGDVIIDEVLAPIEGEIYRPAWSPEGDKLAYVMRTRFDDVSDEGFNRIVVLDADGSNRRVLSAGPHSVDERLMWALDGQSLFLTPNIPEEARPSPEEQALRRVNVATGEIESFVLPAPQCGSGPSASPVDEVFAINLEIERRCVRREVRYDNTFGVYGRDLPNPAGYGRSCSAGGDGFYRPDGLSILVCQEDDDTGRTYFAASFDGSDPSLLFGTDRYLHAESPDGAAAVVDGYNPVTGYNELHVENHAGGSAKLAEALPYYMPREGWAASWQPKPITTCTIEDPNPPAEKSAPGRAFAGRATGVAQVGVGPWDLRGCFKPVSGTTDQWTAKDSLTLDGIEIDLGDGTATIDKTGQRLTSTEAMTVKVGPLGKQAVLDKTATTFNLAGTSLPLAIPGDAFGLPLTVQTTAIQSTGVGTAIIPLSIRTPGLLGGVTGTMTLEADGAAVKRSSIKAHVDSASLGGLLKVSNFDLALGDDGWVVSGELNGSPLTGSMSYVDGALTAGSLSASDVTVAQLFKTNVALAFGSGTWSGSWSLAGGPALAATFSTSPTQVLSGSVSAANFDLFGVAKIESFALSRTTAGAWSLAGTTVMPNGTAPASTLNASLTIADGALQAGARISATNISFGQAVVLKDFVAKYGGGTTWSGSLAVAIPGANGATVAGSASFVDGAFDSASLKGSDLGLALGPGITLRSVGAALRAPSNGDGWRVDGRLGVDAGPSVGGKPAIALDGALTMQMRPRAVTITGRVDAAMGDQKIANAAVFYSTNGLFAVEGTVNLKFPGATASGTLRAIVQNGTFFEATGSGKVGVMGQVISGRILATPGGITGCGKLSNENGTVAQVGFARAWSGETKSGEGSCDAGQFSVLPTPSAKAARGSEPTSAKRPTTTNVPNGLPSVTFRATGTDGVPKLTVTEPGGRTFAVRATKAGNFEGYSVLVDKASKAIVLIVDAPRGGTWSIAAVVGPAVTRLQMARGLPAPVVSASVATTRGGQAATLTWSMNSAPGQTLRFVENGPGASQVLATASASGSVAFLPTDGAAGTHEIVAIVEQDGFPRLIKTVATFVSPEGYRLTRIAQGRGSIALASGANCSSTCTDRVVTAQLTATPASGYRFRGWSGACAGTEPTCTVTLDQAATVTARFVQT